MQLATLVVCRRQRLRVLADDVEQAEGVCLGLDDARLDQPVEHVGRRTGAADLERRRRRELALEEREPAEQVPRRRVEQVEAPVDRGEHRLLAPRRIARALRENREVGVKQPEQLGAGDRPEPGRGELDREWQAVQAPTQLG